MLVFTPIGRQSVRKERESYMRSWIGVIEEYDLKNKIKILYNRTDNQRFRRKVGAEMMMST